MAEARRYTTNGLANLANFTASEYSGKGYSEMDAKTPLKDYISAWMRDFKENTVKCATYDRLGTSLKALERYDIAEKPIGDITFFDIQRYVNQLTKDGYALTTIKKQMRIVTAPLKQAAALRIIPSDPSIGVRLPSRANVKKQSREVFAYNDIQQGLIWQSIESNPSVGYLAIGLMMETGLRAGELLALRWREVNLPGRRIRVNATVVNLANRKQSFVQDSPKSFSSIRYVPLTERAVRLLTMLRQDNNTEWVVHCRDTHLSYEALRYQTVKLCKELSLPYHGEHVFRHTFATNCYYKGIDVKILSKLLGHSDTSVTYNVYIHLYGDGFDALYAALNS